MDLRALPVLLVLAALGPASAAHADDPFLRRTATVRVVEQVGPAVVNITAERAVRRQQVSPFGNPFFDQFFKDLFEPNLQQRAQSLGSGVVIDDQGHVLTNEHVVAHAAVIRITLQDGRELGAELVGADSNHDLAVLQITGAQSVPFVTPGSSEGLMVGEPLIAIGNPFGLSNSVTTGVLSAANRSFRSNERIFHGFLQTDAAINPGNSGGPLLTADGELVGINTAIYGGAEGVGFAIPIDAAKRVVRELLAHGEVAPVWLGLDLQDLSPRLLEVMGLPERLTGALVSRVRPDGPAQAAGVRRGDVVIRLAETPIRSAREFYEILERSTAGQELAVDLRRDGAEHTRELRSAEIPDALFGELLEQLVGTRLAPSPPSRASGTKGWVVTAVREGSGARRTGIEVGDRILAIGGRVLRDEAALQRAVLDCRGRARTLVVVLRGRGRYHVTVPLG